MVDALMDVDPVVGELITTVQEPVPPAVVQVLGPTNVDVAPFEFVTEKLMTVPSGAFTKPAPEPSFTFTCPVRVWFVPISFAAVGGVIWMLASTNVLTAGPELPPVPLVVTVIDAPLMFSVEVAVPVTFPAVGEVKVIVH
jgi:hypothetical protein